MQAGDQNLHKDSRSSLTWTGPHITSLEMYKRRPLFLGMGLENLPFLLLYPFVFIRCFHTFGDPYAQRLLELQSEFGDAFQSKLEKEEFLLPNPYLPGLYPLLLLFLLGGSHILVHLMQVWFVSVKLLLKFSKAKTVAFASHMRCLPSEHRGKEEVVPLKRFLGVISFEFQRHRYIFDEDSETFRLVFADQSRPLTEFSGSNGLEDEQTISDTFDRFGKNICDIPLPTFWSMYEEQLLQPITVFQIFCTLLWLLDEYWRYSLFSGFMILVFEATTVYSRLRNLKTLRGLAAPPREVMVLRCGRWIAISTADLLVNDVFKLSGETVPCDCLLIEGSAVVNEASLTGESHPQLKEAIAKTDTSVLDSDGKHRVHVLFGGTELMQINTAESADPVVFALQTGFRSSQGRLMQMIEYSNQNVTGDWKDALFLVLFLSCFAVASAGYVLHQGIMSKKSSFELLLHAVLIVTSVIPPELPMQTAMAVNAAVAALMKLHVFCTEPFRIPIAGKVELCLFDKTGTLTSDKLVVAGIWQNKTLVDVENASKGVQEVLRGCHSLVSVNGKYVGDPLEEAAFSALPQNTLPTVAIERFHFSSKLQRMSVIVKGKVLVKGSPEAIALLLTQVPSDYMQQYKYLARQGMRVLALASKQIGSTFPTNREEAESDLLFEGFIAFKCLVRKDSRRLCIELEEAAHKVIMVTGDALLTAVYVAEEIGLLQRPDTLMLQVSSDESLGWYKAEDDSFVCPFKGENVKELSEKYSLSVRGDAFEYLSHMESSSQIQWECIKVFARMTPFLKELLVSWIQKRDITCLFCGDGSNDVGALKQAMVGVALLSGFGDLNASGAPEEESEAERIAKKKAKIEMKKKERQLKLLEKQERLRKDAEARAARGESWAWFKAAAAMAQEEAKEVSKLNGSSGFAKRAQQLALDEYIGEMEDQDMPSIKLGDASIAAPFTAKTPSIQAVKDVLKRGRAALVQTLQMYQILALNCLISSYSLSVLYLDGIKYGDRQMTASGILMTIAFLALSRASPLEKLASVRPPKSIFHPSLFLSLLGQFALHLGAMALARHLVIEKVGVYEKPKEFEPNLLNTVVFLVSTVQNVAVFAVNYKGKPFMQGMAENPGLLYSLGACALMVFMAASESVPVLNTLLQLVSFPDIVFSRRIFMILLVDVVGAAVWNLVITFVFARKLFWAGFESTTWQDIAKLGRMVVVLGILVHMFMPDENTFKKLQEEGIVS